MKLTNFSKGIISSSTGSLFWGFLGTIYFQYISFVGFFVCQPKVFDYITGDATVFEQEPLNELVKDKEMMAWKHQGFWGCMDTLRDKNYLGELWETGTAPWKIWED